MNKIDNKPNLILNKLKDFIFVSVFVVFLSYGIVSIFWNKQVVNIFHYEFNIIKSNSMSPFINKFDFVVVKKKSKNLKTGDVVVFLDNSKQHKIIHRIVFTTAFENGQTLFQTKGDNSPKPDNVWHSYSDIYAQYAFTIPYIGFVVAYLTSYLGITNILVWIIVFVFLDTVWNNDDDDFETNNNPKFNKFKNVFKK